MDQDAMMFEEFLAARMRDKGISLKRLAEATGIAHTHLENMLHGNFEDMPSTPYFHGYIMRLAKVLDFDGEEWWAKLKKENLVKNSGPADSLPRNRFMKKSVPKLLWVGIVVVVLLIIYLAFQFSRIFGKPTLTIEYPGTNPFTTSSSTITIGGVVENADSLSINDNQEISIGSDGSWQESVLLNDGPNAFKISAKKLLGSETDVTEEIIYMGISSATASSTSSPTLSSSSGTSNSGASNF
jgi:cytoskeletal protein RodZ